MKSQKITRREVLKNAPVTALGISASQRVLASGTVGTGAAARSGRKIRMGVVGGGFGANFHWHQHPNCLVTGVSDLRPDRRKRLQERYHCDAVYDSMETMLKEARDLDALAIFTEAPNHEKHVRMAMERDLDVISAVPACLTLEEAARLKQVKKSTGRKYMMAETSYYRHYCIAARELQEAGTFGELFYSEVEYYHPHIGRRMSPLSFHEGKRTWRYGFPPMLYPTHSTGFLIGVTDERFTQVSCLGWGNPDNPALKDNVYSSPFNASSAMFQTDRGHFCRCNVFWDGTAHGERAQWFGTKLTFYMPGSGGQPFRLQGPDAPKWEQIPEYRDRLPEGMEYESGHGGSHPFLTLEFITALLEDREPVIDLKRSLAMTVPGIIAHRSALDGGRQLKIPGYYEI